MTNYTDWTRPCPTSRLNRRLDEVEFRDDRTVADWQAGLAEVVEEHAKIARTHPLYQQAWEAPWPKERSRQRWACLKR